MRRILLSLSLLLLTLSPTANAQTVSVPNTLNDGSVADADAMNANFTELEVGVNAALANRATDCAAAGGTWDPGTSTCTPASSYNCFIGGFCAELASLGYFTAPDNVYDGHTQGTAPALGAGCNEFSGSALWLEATSYVIYSVSPPFLSYLVCQ